MDLQPSVTNTPGILLVAASKDDFQASLGCGACVKILGRRRFNINLNEILGRNKTRTNII